MSVDDTVVLQSSTWNQGVVEAAGKSSSSGTGLRGTWNCPAGVSETWSRWGLGWPEGITEVYGSVCIFTAQDVGDYLS